MFIARGFSLPQERGSCREVMSAPLVEGVQRPRARPGSLAFKKRGPNSAHTFCTQVRRKRWRDGRETRFQPRAQRSAKPFFPWQRKCLFPLGKNFLRQEPTERFHKQCFLRAGAMASCVGEGTNKFHQRRIQQGYTHFQRT